MSNHPAAAGAGPAPRSDADSLDAVQADCPGWEITVVKLSGGPQFRAVRPGRNIMVRDLATLRVMLSRDPGAGQADGDQPRMKA